MTTHYAFDGTFDKLISQPGRVVVDFYADWCGPCVSLGPILEEGAKLGSYKLIKINCDEDSEGLADRFKVSGIPHVVVFQDGVELSDKGFTGNDQAKALALRK
jgi:thioredoxin 1